jgi:hypothetical protein
MQHRRPLASGLVAAVLVLLAAVVPGGCGVLNPSLTGTVTSNGVGTMYPPEGTILIAVFNTTTSIAAARLEITKNNGGVVQVVVPVQPSSTNPANQTDQGVVVQDCDVQSIRLVEVLASIPGGVMQFGTGLPPLDSPGRLSCGNLVVVTITGSTPNLAVSLNVF